MTTPTLSERPDCWAFAMDFLGDPESPIVEAYVAGLEAERERLRDECARLRAEAERYAWLRMKTAGLRDNEGRQYFSFPSLFGLRPVTDIMQGSVGQHLDKAIDAAILSAKG